MEPSSDNLLRLQAEVAEFVVRASEPAKSSWNTQSKFLLKSDNTPVTEIDSQIENTLRSNLSSLIPEAGFIVEEGETDIQEGYNWVIDPIDQTKNFIYRLPLFYTQVALVYNNDPILGVIYNPVSEQIFVGSKGNGVSLNRLKLVLDNNINPYIDLDFGSTDSDNEWKFPILHTLNKESFMYRMTGASYAPYILTNAIEGYLVLNQQTKLVDQYPRHALMKALGFIVETFTISEKKVIIAGREQLVNTLVSVVRNSLG